MLKLWKVTGEVEVVVAAEDHKSAWEYAREAIREAAEDDDFVANVSGKPIETVEALPYGWDTNCIPYGDGDRNTRIGKFFEQ